jgi:pheromone shutdown protein TraB
MSMTWFLFLQNGLMSGLMQMLLLKVSAHITEQLGMAPGGEFREAFKEVGARCGFVDTLVGTGGIYPWHHKS